MRRVLAGNAQIHAHGHTLRAQQANGIDGLFESAGIMAEIIIGFLVRAIECDIHAPGLVLAEEARPILVDQRAVGIDRHEHAQLLKLKIKPAEIREEQRLAAGQQQKERAAVAHLVGNFQPFICRAQAALALHLRA